MTTPREPACTGCTRYQGPDSETGRLRCSSFPDGIPSDIVMGRDPHVAPRDGEPTYEPKSVESLARFVGDFIVPQLNPSLGPEWAKRTGGQRRRHGSEE